MSLLQCSNEFGSEGLLATVNAVSFSVPTYKLGRKRAPPSLTVKRAASKVTVTVARVSGVACNNGRCKAILYAMHKSGIKKTLSQKASAKSSKTGSFIVQVPTTKLPKGTRFSVVLKYEKGANRGKVITSVLGVVT
jgi:hypothetical protein